MFIVHHSATTTIYTLSLHDALPIYNHRHDNFFLSRFTFPIQLPDAAGILRGGGILSHCAVRQNSGRNPQSGEQSGEPDRKSTRLNSSHVRISYAVFCMKSTPELT